MRPKTFDIAVPSSDADGVCQSQTPGAAGSLTLNGALVSDSVATFNAGQQVDITSSGNDSGITFTVTGTDADGVAITEDITGPNSTTVTTTYYFKTVTDVSVDGAGTGNITVGVAASNGLVSQSIPVDVKQTPFNMSLFADITAESMTYSVQYTYDDPWGSVTEGLSNNGDWRDVSGLSAETIDAVSNLAYPVTAVRFKETANNGSGTATFGVIQGSTSR